MKVYVMVIEHEDYLHNVREYLYTPNSNPCEKDIYFYDEFAFIMDTLRLVPLSKLPQIES